MPSPVFVVPDAVARDLVDLLKSKREAGRHKDLDDVEHLSATHGRAAPTRKRRGR